MSVAQGEARGAGNIIDVRTYSQRLSLLSQRRMERGLTLAEVALALRAPVVWLLRAERDRRQCPRLRCREAQLLIKTRWPT